MSRNIQNAAGGIKNSLRKLGRKIAGLKTWQKVVGAILVVVAAAGLVIGVYAIQQLNKIDKVEINEGEISCVDVDGYVNILLLGVDSRDMKDIQGAGADAIMIMSLKEETGEVKLTSIYRDTYIKCADSDNCYKITDINRIGGPELLIKSMNEALDLNISKFAVVNFKAVADLVNAVDGIELDIQEYEIEQLNKYTRQTARNIGQKEYQTVKTAGLQTLEGVQAVSYGRIRKGVGDDFKRTERMRIVLNKVFDKLKDSGIKELNAIMDAVLKNVQTNMSTSDMLILATKLNGFSMTIGDGWPFEVTTGMLDGISYVFASDFSMNVMELHKKLFGQEEFELSETAAGVAATIDGRRNSSSDQHTVDVEEEANKDNPDYDKNKKKNQDDKNKEDASDDKSSDKSDNKSDNNNKDDNKDNNKNDNKDDNKDSQGTKPDQKTDSDPAPTPKPDPTPAPKPEPAPAPTPAPAPEPEPDPAPAPEPEPEPEPSPEQPSDNGNDSAGDETGQS